VSTHCITSNNSCFYSSLKLARICLWWLKCHSYSPTFIWRDMFGFVVDSDDSSAPASPWLSESSWLQLLSKLTWSLCWNLQPVCWPRFRAVHQDTSSVLFVMTEVQDMLTICNRNYALLLNLKAYYHFHELVVGACHELLDLSPQSHSQFCQIHLDIVLPFSCTFSMCFLPMGG